MCKTLNSKCLRNKNIGTKKHNNLLKVEVEKLKNDLSSFVRSTKIFPNIMVCQSKLVEKECLDFDMCQKQRLFNKLFVPK